VNDILREFENLRM